MAETISPEISPLEADALVKKYSIDPNEVLSANNITQTATNPASVPSDLQGIIQTVYGEQGVTVAEKAYNDALAKRLSAENDMFGAQQERRNDLSSLAKIGGRQAQISRQFEGTIRNLTLAEQLAQNSYLSKKSFADKLVDANYTELAQVKQLQIQYPNAKIKSSDNWDEITEKVRKSSEKEMFKESLRALGLSTKGSRRELENRLEKANAEEHANAKRATELQLEQLELSVKKAREASAAEELSIEDLFPETGDSPAHTESSNEYSGAINSYNYDFYGV